MNGAGRGRDGYLHEARPRACCRDNARLPGHLSGLSGLVWTSSGQQTAEIIGSKKDLIKRPFSDDKALMSVGKYKNNLLLCCDVAFAVKR